MNTIFKSLTIFGLASLLAVIPTVVHAQPLPRHTSLPSAIDFNYLGLTKFKQGDYQGAIQDYNQAIRLNPKFAFAYNNRGTARLQLGDKQGAIADFNKAVELNPQFAPGENAPVIILGQKSPYQIKDGQGRNLPDKTAQVGEVPSGIGGPDLDLTSGNNLQVVVVQLSANQPQNFRYRQGDAEIRIPISSR